MTVLLSNNGTMAQRKSLKDIHVFINVQHRSILDVFSEIEGKTGFNFAYNNVNVKNTDSVTLITENKNLATLLGEIAGLTGLRFKRINDNIHVSRGESSVRKIPTVTEVFSKVITGKITALDDKLPMPGVNVIVKGTTIGTTSDTNGDYSLDVPDETSVLVFSFIGYQTKEVIAGSQTTIDISLATDVTSLEEVVVTGYGSQKKSDVTGAVGVVDVEEAKKTVTYDVAKMLQGQVAGVTVQSSGEPGGFVNIKIRGVTSFSNNNPLFVIDGIIVDDPYDFAPGDIESIQVLKDASSAAIYGVRGANGVVVITTKKGSTGKFSVNFKSLYGFQTVPKKISLTDREGYQKITNAAYINSGQAILPGNDPSNASYIDNVDTDWQDAAYTTGRIQNHALTFGGGSEVLSYNMNVDYYRNTGYIDSPQDYERTSTSLNLTGKKGKFRYGSKLGYTQSDKENFNEYLDGTSSVINLLQAIPTMPVYDENRLGGYGGTDNLTQRAITLNVVGFNNLLENSSDRTRFLGNIWGELEIVRGLKYTLRASADRLEASNRYYVPTSDLGWYYITTEDEASLDVRNDHEDHTVLDNLLNYDLQVQKHKIEAFLGWVMERRQNNDHWSRGVGYEAGEISKLQYADNISAGEFTSTETRMSYLSRLNYIYDDRYLFTANFRQDKTSLFAKNNNTGNYFSLSAAWKIHNDIKLPDVITTAKLRGGYGQLGNNTIGVYDYSAVINPFAGYTFNNVLAPGTTAVDLKDQNVKWEDTETVNVALELGMFDNRLEFTAEYYTKTCSDLLADVPLPFSTGAFPASITTNAAKVVNKGLEFTLGYVNDDHNFKYAVSANLGTLKNEVLKIGEQDLPISGINSRTEVGRSIGDLYVYQTDGIFQNQAEIDAHAVQPGATIGDIRFKDVKADGQITDDDRVYQGSTIPKLSYGLNFNSSYKNWDFSFFFQGNAGNKVYNGTYNALMIGGLLNHHTDMLNYWTPDNPNTNVPRPDVLETNQNARQSNRFIEKGDYLKLQNIQLGYNIPFKNRKIIEKARVYVSGQNVLTISKYRGYDPDFISDGLFARGFDYGSFPNPRTLLVGIEVGF
jgi:TonB-linked SusC/RagA family outer membrane protein